MGDATRAINHPWFNPFNKCYDARACDAWSLYTLLYHCVADEPLYALPDVTDDDEDNNDGPHAMKNKKLYAYLLRSNLLKKVKCNSLMTKTDEECNVPVYRLPVY